MILTSKPARTLSKSMRFAMLFAGFIGVFFLRQSWVFGEEGASLLNTPFSQEAGAQNSEARSMPVSGPAAQLLGLTILRIGFQGVDESRFTPLPERLGQMVGTPLTEENLARSLRLVYGSGLFETVEVEGVREPSGVDLIFRGAPRMFIGTVNVVGAKGATINTQLERAARLQPGTRFSQARLDLAEEQMRQALADNGFHQPTITHAITTRPGEQLADIAFKIASGPRARIGAVQVSGEPGMSLEEFRRRGHLRPGAHIDHDTVNRALNGVLKHYQKQERLEAEIKLESQTCSADAKRCDYKFTATRGPVVRIRVTGAGIGSDRLK